MPAYFLVQSTISDQARFQEYREAVVPFIAKFGGKLVARGAGRQRSRRFHCQAPRELQSDQSRPLRAHGGHMHGGGR